MIEFDHTLHPFWLGLGVLLVGAFLYWGFLQTKRATHSRLAVIITLLRGLAVAMVLLFLLNPVWVEKMLSGDPLKIAVLVDTSESMAFESEGLTRIDAAKQWVNEKLDIPSHMDVDLYGFGAAPTQLSLEQMTPKDSESSIAETLDVFRSGLITPLPGGVILLSDGADRSELDMRETALWFREMDIPIHTILAGESDDTSDLVVEHVEAPQQASDNTVVTVHAHIRAPGFQGKTIPLQIYEDDRLVSEKRIKVTESAMSVPLEFYPGNDGFRKLQLKIPPQQGERTPDNNQREFGLTVLDQSLRVLYMEGSGMQGGVCQPMFLKHALESAADIEVKVLHCDQYGSPPHMHSQIAFVDPRDGSKVFRVQNPTMGYPQTLDDLLNYDVVISSDIPKEAFSGQQLKFTERFVTEFGGGFIMIGGNTSFGSGGYDQTIIDRIVPVEMNISTDSLTTTFQARIPESAWSHPIMQLGENDKETRKIWLEKFPVLKGFNIVDRLKPGAVGLLEHPNYRAQSGNAIVLAAQEVGKGRTMAFTTDTTYLWGQDFQTLWGEPIDPSKPMRISNCDSRYYTQFWINAVRWLSANKFQSENEALEIRFAKTYYAPDKTIKGVIAMQESSGSTGVQNVSVQLLKGDQIVSSDVSTTKTGPGNYEVSLKLAGLGPFRLRASAELKDGTTMQANRLLIGESGHWETMDGRCNPTLLQDIANWSGGRFARADEDSEMVMNNFGQKNRQTEKSVRKPLWDKGWWLVVFLGLVTTEWVIRKRAGMA